MNAFSVCFLFLVPAVAISSRIKISQFQLLLHCKQIYKVQVNNNEQFHTDQLHLLIQSQEATDLTQKLPKQGIKIQNA